MKDKELARELVALATKVAYPYSDMANDIADIAINQAAQARTRDFEEMTGYFQDALTLTELAIAVDQGNLPEAKKLVDRLDPYLLKEVLPQEFLEELKDAR